MSSNSEALVLSAGPSTYVVLWVPVAALIALFIVDVMRGAQGLGAPIALALAAGLLGTFGIARLRLSISSEAIKYRGSLRTHLIPLPSVRSMYFGRIGLTRSRHAFGGVVGPSIMLRIETLTEPDSPFYVPIKPFRLSDLKKFVDRAQTLGIGIDVNSSFPGNALRSLQKNN